MIGQKLQVAMNLYSTITALQKVQKDDIVGYSATRKADKAQSICSFPL